VGHWRRSPQSVVPLRTHTVGSTQTVLPPEAFETIAKAAALAGDLTKPDGHVVQWGDNDSGRLVKLQPAWTRVQRCSEAGAAWSEDSLDHRSLVAATAAITGSDELSSFAGQWLEAHLARALACGRRVPVGSAAPIISVINEELDFELFLREIECCLRKSQAFRVRAARRRRTRRGSARRYPDFGHYVFRGSGRSAVGRCRYFGPKGFVGEAIGVNWPVTRALLLRPARLVLIDASPAVPLVPWLPADDLPLVCWGYGRTTARPPRSF
jgi:hypothetical protein